MSKNPKLGWPEGIQSLGGWEELVLAKDYGAGKKKYSIYDRALNDEFGLALEGNLRAIRTMLKVYEANVAARNQFYNVPGRIVRGEPPPPLARARNADLALLLLGICAVTDAELEELKNGDADTYTKRLRRMQPDVVQYWVIERWGETEQISEHVSDQPQVSNWEANKDEILADLMSVRGPEGARFCSGKSGNPRGRPQKEDPGPPLPYNEFFTGIVAVTVNGKKRRMTRQDALFWSLAIKMGKGDEKIRHILLEHLRKREE